MTAVTVHASSKPEHIPHAIKARRPADQPLCGPQGAAGEDQPVGGAMGDFDALAGRGERHGMLADDVPGPHHGEADAARLARLELPCRSKTATSARASPRAAATASPKASAVPEGASRFIR